MQGSENGGGRATYRLVPCDGKPALLELFLQLQNLARGVDGWWGYVGIPRAKYAAAAPMFAEGSWDYAGSMLKDGHG